MPRLSVTHSRRSPKPYTAQAHGPPLPKRKHAFCLTWVVGKAQRAASKMRIASRSGNGNSAALNTQFVSTLRLRARGSKAELNEVSCHCRCLERCCKFRIAREHPCSGGRRKEGMAAAAAAADTAAGEILEYSWERHRVVVRVRRLSSSSSSAPSARQKQQLNFKVGLASPACRLAARCLMSLNDLQGTGSRQ